MNWLDVVERGIWTFVQGAIGTVAVVPVVTDIAAWEAVGVAALTGGISALISFVKTIAQERLAFPDTRAEIGG